MDNRQIKFNEQECSVLKFILDKYCDFESAKRGDEAMNVLPDDLDGVMKSHAQIDSMVAKIGIKIIKFLNVIN
jgi:hypothetical protein